jgi:hypothetical protein
MEKTKHHPTSTHKKFLKWLGIFVAFIVISFIILSLGGHYIDFKIEDWLAIRETLVLETGTNQVLTTTKNFTSSGEIVVRGLQRLEDGRYVMRLSHFVGMGDIAPVNFDYLEINGQPASGVLQLDNPRIGEHGRITLYYQLATYEFEPIEIRILDGFAEQTFDLNITIINPFLLPPCGCF